MLKNEKRNLQTGGMRSRDLTEMQMESNYASTVEIYHNHQLDGHRYPRCILLF